MYALSATVSYAESPDTLAMTFRLVKPTVGTSVPRVYEKLYDAIRAQASESPAKKRVFEWAVGVGQAYHTTDAPGYLLTAKHRLRTASSTAPSQNGLAEFRAGWPVKAAASRKPRRVRPWRWD